MKRWVIGVLIAIAVLATGYRIWDRVLSHETPGERPDDTPPQPYHVSNDPIEAIAEFLSNEFFEPDHTKPSPAARLKIKELARRGQRNNDAATALKDWLRRMFETNQVQADEFGELAMALLAVEPGAPGHVARAHFIAQDDMALKFAEAELRAFGKPALPALLQGLQDEAGNPAFVAAPTKSRLPGVLAKLGAAAVPGLVSALGDDSSYVCAQAVRALKGIGPGPAAAALPGLIKLLDDPHKSSVHVAVVDLLGDFGPRAKMAAPSLNRLAAAGQSAEIREAARSGLHKIDP